MENQFGIIALESYASRATQIDEYLKSVTGSTESFLIGCKSVRFANGEGKVVLTSSVRNKTIFILSDVSNYSVTYTMYGCQNRMSPDDHFQDIKRTISAIGGKAKKIIVVTPLLYEARQHRRTMRESLDCALGLQDLEKMGVDAIITFDAHDSNIQNAVSKMSFDSFFPSYQILKEFLKHEKHKIDANNMVVISPDTGAMARAIKYANMLGLDVGMFYKRRDYTTVVNGKNPVVQHEYLGRDVNGKYILIVDDMIASGGSVLDIAKELCERGAKGAYAIATFSFFTNGTEIFDEYYNKNILKKVYTTNLSYLPDEIKQKKWFVSADVNHFLGKIILKTANSESISGLIDDEKLKDLLLSHNLQYEV